MSREMVNSGIAWIGEIPKDWSIMPHKRVMYKVKEIQEHYNGEKILSLTMRGVIVRDLDAGGKMPTSFDGYQKVYPNNLLQCLFDIDVTPRCVGLIKHEGLTSPAYSQFAMYPNGYAPYYDYLLRYMDDGKTLLHLSKNLRNSLTETDFGAIYTCVPSSIEEQQKIAEFLDRKCSEIDEMIGLQEQIIEELKAYKQSVITEAVTKGLKPNAPMRDSGIEWIGEIPEHWRIGKIKMIAKTNSGSTPKTISQTEESSIVWIRTTDINDNLVTDSSLHLTQEELNSASCPMLNKDVCVVAMYGGGGTIGKCGILGVEATINQALCSIEVKSFHLGAFMFWTLRATRYNWMKFAVGTRKDPNISQEIVRNYIVPIPPIEEQQKISDYLNTQCTEIDNLISIKQSKIDSLKEYKKSIIYEYVTGKRGVE